MLELDACFQSFDEWQAWQPEAAPYRDAGLINAALERIRHNGFTEPLTARQVAGDDISQPDLDPEHMVANGLNGRSRATLRAIDEAIAGRNPVDLGIYAAEALSPFAAILRARFPRFLASEFASDPAMRDWLYPIPHLDLCALDLPDAKFDLVTTNHVLEHVPDLDQALGEIRRVLRPGCWHIGTLPFHAHTLSGERRAAIEDGRLVHLMEPEYHGDPMDPGGALVFEIPGWDILDRARAAGFQRAYMRLIASERAGVISALPGAFVFYAQR